MQKEALSSYYFTIEIDGIQTDRFFSCEGLEMETDVYETEEGGYNTSTHKHLGHARSKNLILKKGISKNSELSKWFKSNQEGSLVKKTISVIHKDPSGLEIKRWNLYKAFPCRWKVQTLDVHDTSFPIEIIEIAYG